LDALTFSFTFGGFFSFMGHWLAFPFQFFFIKRTEFNDSVVLIWIDEDMIFMMTGIMGL